MILTLAVPTSAVTQTQPAGGRVEAATYRLVVEVALQLFAEDGYEATSVRDIARAVGVKPASLYSHFPSKEDVLWAIVQRAIADLEAQQRDALANVTGPGTMLRTFVRTHTAYHARHSLHARIVNERFRSLSPARLAEVVAFRDRYEVLLRDILREGAARGLFDVSDLKLTSFSILQMGMAVAIWFREDGTIGVEAVCDHYVEMALRMTRCVET